MEVSSALIIRKMKETNNSNLLKIKVQAFANIELIYVTELFKKFGNVNLIILKSTDTWLSVIIGGEINMNKLRNNFEILKDSIYRIVFRRDKTSHNIMVREKV